jgi:hypothetical protein
MAANNLNPSIPQVEMQRVEKSHEASYLENIQSQGYEHLGDPLQIEFNKTIEEIRNWILAQAQNAGATLVSEVENPPISPDQPAILVYYLWRTPVVQAPPAEPQAFACPYCTQPFMAVPGAQSQVVACPSCGGANIVPAAEQPAQQTAPAAEPSATEAPAAPLAPPPAAEIEEPQTPVQETPPEQVSTPSATESEELVKSEPEQAPVAEATVAPAAEPPPPVTETPAPAASAPPVATDIQTEPETESEATAAAPSPEPAASTPPAAPAAQAAPTSPTAPSAPVASEPAEPTAETEQVTENAPEYGQEQEYQYEEYGQSATQQYSTEMPSFDFFSKKVESETNKPKEPLLTPEYEQSYTTTFTSVEQAIKINMQKLSDLLANPRNTIKFYDSGELMYPKVTIRKSAYTHLGTREMDLLLIKDGVNDYKIISNESHGTTGGNITPMQDELFAIKTLGHSSFRAMEDWAYLDNEQKIAVSKCIFAFTDIYFKKLPKPEEE